MSLLGIHVGAERVTAGVYDIEGRLLGRGGVDYHGESPQPGVSEVYMDVVWGALKDAVAKARAHVEEPVTAMSLAVCGESAVAIDRDGRALGASILPDDTQADAVAREYHERVSPIDVMRQTGMPPVSNSRLVRMLWLKATRPDVYQACWKFMGWHEHLANRFGLGPVTDPSLAGRTQMFDIVNGAWADRVLGEAGVEREKLPDVKPAGTLLGDISRRAAEELGLPAGVKFVVGGCDHSVAALGVGAVAGGQALNATGGAEWLVAALHEPALDVGMLKNGFSCTPHVIGGTFVSVAVNPSGGRLMTWLCGLLAAGRDGREAVDGLLAEMDRRPTDLLVLPYFGPSGTPYGDKRALGSVVGMDAGTSRGTIVRAALEGLALEMKLNASLLAESGIRLNEARVAGPAARSRDWCQIKADVLGLAVKRYVDLEPASLGAAMLAGLGAGVYDGFVSAVEFCVNAEDTVYPAGPRVDHYEKQFERYRRLYPALREIVG